MDKAVKSEVFENNANELVEIVYDNVNIKVKQMLSYSEMLVFVKFVESSCFNDETGEYQPEMIDYAIRYALIEMFTDIELPEENALRYEFVYDHDDLLADIISVINNAQLKAMTAAIDDKVSTSVQDGINRVVQNMNELYNSFARLGETLEKQFDGVDANDIKNVIDAVTEAGFDETKFVKAYMEATK